MRRIRPFPQGGGRAGIEFVPIGGDDYGIGRVNTVGKNDQAHGDFRFDLIVKAMVA
jgi:hypothetical protein